MKKLSLVVPVYYEQEVILQFLKETKEELEKLSIDYEYVFVDDGSKDKTVEIIKEQAKLDDRIKLIVFSYNHGKASAVSAAIANATGDYLLYMDPDLQDPPIEISRFLNEIEKINNSSLKSGSKTKMIADATEISEARKKLYAAQRQKILPASDRHNQSGQTVG